MTRAKDISKIITDADFSGTLDVAGNFSVDGGTIKLDGNYPVGTDNVALGNTALDSLTSGNYNTAVGADALTGKTSGGVNTAIGWKALELGGAGDYNVGLGSKALQNNTGSYNTAVGQLAGSTNTTGSHNLFLGQQSGTNTTGGYNTFAGQNAGSVVSSGTKNTIIGRFSGNQGNLDIRTSSNNIVLSDGDGNVRSVCDSTGSWELSDNNLNSTLGDRLNIYGKIVGSSQFGISVAGNANTYFQYAMRFYNTYFSNIVGSITFNTTSTTYATSSDHRLKENVTSDWDATTRIKQLNPVRFNFIADADTTVDGFLAHEVQSVVPEAISGTHNEVEVWQDGEKLPDGVSVGDNKLDEDGNTIPVYQGIDQSKIVPLLVKTIQELEARITALENA